MFRLTAIALIAFAPTLALADDDSELVPCKFKGHTTVGIVAGKCTTQQRLLPGFHARWALSLQFDANTATLARKILPDQFADIVRTQSTEDGADMVILSLWGDLKLTSTTEEYADLIKSTAPTYETRPNLITVTKTKDIPFTLEVLFEETDDYLNLTTRMPSPTWQNMFIQSYMRLGTNRPDGFSSSDGGGGTSKPRP
jgi:hypothetical protein